MNKICTTIDQSKKLIELGIDINTADMYWLNRHIDLTGTKYEMFVVDRSNEHIDFFNSYAVAIEKGEIIPAWSLSALLELMPKELEDDLELCYGTFGSDGEYHPLWVCSCMNYVLFGNTLVDAVFKVLCWLKENGKI